MARCAIRTAFRAAVFLLVPLALVHATPGYRSAVFAQGKPAAKATAKPPSNPGPTVRYGTDGLPAPVLEMREAILAAVKSGRVEDLRTAIELNEIKPAFSDGPVPDPIALLKQLSTDGHGFEILAAMANILDAGYATVPLGRDLENNRVYVWPHFAETGVSNLSPTAEVELHRLVPAAEARRMQEAGKYTFWKLGIGADGVWHFFVK